MRQRICVLALLISAAAVFAEGGLDAVGDPLPAMARSRLGSVRLWQGMHIRGLAFSMDDQVIVSGGGIVSSTPTVMVWDTETGKRVGTLGDGSFSVLSMRSSPDQKRLAVSTNRSRIRIYDVKTSREIANFKARTSTLGLAWTPDSRRLLATNHRQTVLYDIDQRKQVRSWNIAGYGVAIHPDGEVFALCSNHHGRNKKVGHVTVYDLTTGKQVLDIKRQKNLKFIWPSYSHDGKFLAAVARGRAKEDLYIFDSETGKKVRSIRAHGSSVTMVCFAPNRNILATSGYDRKVCIWDAESGKRLAAMDCNTSGGLGLSFSGDGKLLAAGTGQGSIEVWDVETGKPAHERYGHRARITSLGLSPDGRLAATGDQGGKVMLWSLPDGKLLGEVREYSGSPAALKFPRGQEELVVVARGGELSPFAPPRMTRKSQGQTLGEAVLDVRADPYGAGLAAYLRSGKLARWDAESGKVRKRSVASQSERNRSRNALLSPDLRWVLLHKSRGIELVSTHSKGSGFIEHTGMYTYGGSKPFAFAPLSDVFAASEGSGVALFEVDSAEVIDRISASIDAMVTALAFSNNGRCLALGTNAGDLLLYSVETGKELAQLPGHGNQDRKRKGKRRRRHGILPFTITRLRFSQDDRYLVSAGNDTTALVWDVGKLTSLPSVSISEGKLEMFWDQLGLANAAAAHRARWAMAGMGEQAVAFLSERLEPASGANRGEIRRLVRGLDAAKYSDRREAFDALVRVGAQALPELRRVLESSPSAEVRVRVAKLIASLDKPVIDSPAMLQLSRAVRVLERIGSERAVALLADLATGDEASRMTREARAALVRMGRAGEDMSRWNSSR